MNPTQDNNKQTNLKNDATKTQAGKVTQPTTADKGGMQEEISSNVGGFADKDRPRA